MRLVGEYITGASDNLLSVPSWLSPEEFSTYVDFFATEDDEADNAIRKATRTGRPFGLEVFVDLLEF